jgi:Phage derived protein Gp49-like (DUF891)
MLKNNYYNKYLIYKGECYSVFFHAESENRSKVYEYFENCDKTTQASLLYLVKRISDIGQIFDKTKFRIESKANKIYVFKPKKERFFCFFFCENRIIITSAYRKKGSKLDRVALAKAIKIKDEYLK